MTVDFTEIGPRDVVFLTPTHEGAGQIDAAKASLEEHLGCKVVLLPPGVVQQISVVRPTAGPVRKPKAA